MNISNFHSTEMAEMDYTLTAIHWAINQPAMDGNLRIHLSDAITREYSARQQQFFAIRQQLCEMPMFLTSCSPSSSSSFTTQMCQMEEEEEMLMINSDEEISSRKWSPIRIDNENWIEDQQDVERKTWEYQYHEEEEAGHVNDEGEMEIIIDELIGDKESRKCQLLEMIRTKMGRNVPMNGTEIGEAKLCHWRASFQRAIILRNLTKCRLRNALCERMYQFNLQRLQATGCVDPRQLSLADLRIRERFTLRGDRLIERATGRLFVSQGEMFDALLQFHAGTGHGGQKKAIYRQAAKIFANISKELVREFLQGCGQCGGWREKKRTKTMHEDGDEWPMAAAAERRRERI